MGRPPYVVGAGNNMGAAPRQAVKAQRREGSRLVLALLDALRLRHARLFRKSARRCPYGGTGRRVRLKIGFRKECWFDSG